MTIEAGEIVVWVLVFLRTGAFFMGIPLFAGKMLPVKTKTAFGLLLSILINPLVPADLEIATHFAGAILLALKRNLYRSFIGDDGSNGLFYSGISWVS